MNPYLEYPRRRRGLDHDIYAHRNLPDVARVAWPGGARVALWVTVQMGHFPMDMPPTPFVVPGGMERPYPSYWDYTQRDYGNRVGVFRIMRALAARGIPATAFMSGALAERYPKLTDAVKAAGWEVAALGLDMGHVHHAGLTMDEERAIIARAASALRSTFGDQVRGWLSPGHSESANTLDLIAEAGFGWVADWANDEMPYAMATRSGPLTAMPLAWDLSDQRMLFQQHMATEDFCEAVLDAHALLDAEAASSGGGRILCVTLTPWVMGQAHRARAMGDMLEAILARGGVWTATGADILGAWKAGG